MKASELREKSTEELNQELLRLAKEHFNLRMQRASGQLGQTHLIRETKREVARVKTLISERLRGTNVTDSSTEQTSV